MTNIVQNHFFGAAVNGFRKALFWPNIAALAKRRRNRREVASLRALSDLQLADIGLTRREVVYSLRGGMFDDHSRELARTALIRRTLTGSC